MSARKTEATRASPSSSALAKQQIGQHGLDQSVLHISRTQQPIAPYPSSQSVLGSSQFQQPHISRGRNSDTTQAESSSRYSAISRSLPPIQTEPTSVVNTNAGSANDSKFDRSSMQESDDDDDDGGDDDDDDDDDDGCGHESNDEKAKPTYISTQGLIIPQFHAFPPGNPAAIYGFKHQPPSVASNIFSSASEHTGRWTKEEHEVFLDALRKFGKEWKKVAAAVRSRTVVQTRTHAQKYFQKLHKQQQLISRQHLVIQKNYPPGVMMRGFQPMILSEEEQMEYFKMNITANVHMQMDGLTEMDDPLEGGYIMNELGGLVPIHDADGMEVGLLDADGVLASDKPPPQATRRSSRKRKSTARGASDDDMPVSTTQGSSSRQMTGASGMSLMSKLYEGQAEFDLEEEARKKRKGSRKKKDAVDDAQLFDSGKFLYTSFPSPTASGKRKYLEFETAQALVNAFPEDDQNEIEAEALLSLKKSSLGFNKPRRRRTGPEGRRRRKQKRRAELLLERAQAAIAPKPDDPVQFAVTVPPTPWMRDIEPFVYSKKSGKEEEGEDNDESDSNGQGYDDENDDDDENEDDESFLATSQSYEFCLAARDAISDLNYHRLEAMLNASQFSQGNFPPSPMLMTNEPSSSSSSLITNTDRAADLMLLSYLHSSDAAGVSSQASAVPSIMLSSSPQFQSPNLTINVSSQPTIQIRRSVVKCLNRTDVDDAHGRAGSTLAASKLLSPSSSSSSSSDPKPSNEADVLAILKLINSHGGNMVIADKSGWTALHYAAAAGALEVGKFVVRNSKSLLKAFEGDFENRNTPLHIAMERGDVEMCNVLAGFMPNCHLRNRLFQCVLDVCTVADPAIRNKARLAILKGERRLRTAVVTHSECITHDHLGRPTNESRLFLELSARINKLIVSISSKKSLEGIDDEDDDCGFQDGEIDVLGDSMVSRASFDSIARVHSNNYLGSLERIHRKLKGIGGAQVAEAGDTEVLIKPPHPQFSLDASRRAAGAVICAIDHVMSGRYRNAFVLVAFPGRHAFYDGPSLIEQNEHKNFIINNVMVGATHALACYDKLLYGSENLAGYQSCPSFEVGGDNACRIAIVDVGANVPMGSYSIVKKLNSPDRILLLSVFSLGIDGDDDELMSECLRLNCHLVSLSQYQSSESSMNETFQHCVRQQVLPTLRAFRPTLILLGLGLDIIEGDYNSVIGQSISPANLGWFTEQVVQVADYCCSGRLVSLLDGGHGRAISADGGKLPMVTHLQKMVNPYGSLS